MFTKDFEKTVSSTFFFNQADMLEIVDKFNARHVGEDTGISHWDTDRFSLYVDGARLDFGFSDLAAACITWALCFPDEYRTFVKGMTWSNERNMRGYIAENIIETMTNSGL